MEQKSFVIDERCEKLVIQFSSESPKNLPKVADTIYETAEGRAARESGADGEVIFNESQRDCDIQLRPFQLCSMLGGHMLVLVDAFREIRGKEDGGQYHVVRFEFRNTQFTECSERLKKLRSHDVALKALNLAFINAMWSVTVYKNPSRTDPNNFWISVNPKSRQPYVNAGGKDITVCKKDQFGHKIPGTAKPIAPKTRLVLEGNNLILKEA